MIKFIDLRKTKNPYKFSFWNTATNRYLMYSGHEAWNDQESFVGDFERCKIEGFADYPLNRFLSIMPKWTKG